jgi:hypothetical protein
MRNDKIFEWRDPCQARWLCNFKSQCSLQSLRLKPNLRSAFCFC